MNLPLSYTVFFAIPFDPATSDMYRKIQEELSGNPNYAKRLNFVFGKEVVGPSEHFANMQAFKEQNADILYRFYEQINSADIVIADLTNNNANVHLELGIALSQNKNILRLSGRDIVQIASDIKGFYVDQYKNQGELLKIIKDYLDMFFRIKSLDVVGDSPFHKHHFLSRLASPDDALYPEYHRLSTMRDGELRVSFSLQSNDEKEGWFGAYFRFGYLTAPWLGGYLAYVRQNGSIQIVETPTYSQLDHKQHTPLSPNRNYTFHLMVEGSHLFVWLDDEFAGHAEVSGLINQKCGNLAIACYHSVARLESIETVRRDTIDFTDC